MIKVESVVTQTNLWTQLSVPSTPQSYSADPAISIFARDDKIVHLQVSQECSVLSGATATTITPTQFGTTLRYCIVAIMKSTALEELRNIPFSDLLLKSKFRTAFP